MKKLRTILLMGLAAIIAVSSAIGGTLAYLTDTESAVNVMTVGSVKIEQIEQQRDATGALVDFEQNKPALPAVGPIEWDATLQGVNGYNVKMFTPDLKNVVDKIISVKNTGKTKAFIRTIVAIEEPAGVPNDLIHININTAGIDVSDYMSAEIGGVNYTVVVFTYADALEPGASSAPSLLQVFLDSKGTNEECAKFGDTWEIMAITQAVQADGFESAAVAPFALNNNTVDASDAIAALDEAFGEAVPNEDEPEVVEARQVEWFEEAYSIYEATLVDEWDGTADTAWYDETKTEFKLDTAEQLAGLADLVDAGNTFEGKTITLAGNVDLYLEDENGEPVSFDPIGYGYDVVFKGTFDGQGNTISNLYQNGWALGLDNSTEGGGLFASVVDATIKNVNIDNAEIVMECIDMGVVVGYSYGNCTYEDITVTNSSIANYQRYTGGVVGEVNGTQTFKNVDVKDTVISSLWGDFDCSLGGIVGGKWGDAQLTFTDCDVACELNAYNDVTSSYEWYAYRRAGMLIGNSEETTTVEGRTSATASYLTCNNCTVTYGDWVNYTYCEFTTQPPKPNIDPNIWPYVRVQGSSVGQNKAYSNPRYGVAVDAAGNEVVDDNHVHNDGEDHNILLTFDQLYGGGQGVYGTATHDGVTVVYNNK